MMNELLEEVLRQDEDIKKVLKTAVLTTAIGAGALGLGKSLLPSYKHIEPTKTSQHTQTLAKEQPTRTTVVDINRIIKIESNNNSKAVSRVGARGLMQIMPKTWEEITRKMGVDWSWEEAFDPEKNKAVGTYYLNKEIPRLLIYYKIPDTVENRLACYNWGIGNLKKYGIDNCPEETRNYIKKYNQLGEKIIDEEITPEEMEVISNIAGA